MYLLKSTTKLLCFLLLIFLYKPLTAQKHLEVMEDKNLTYKQIIEETEKHYEIVGKGKGVGYKQFQRWKYWAGRNLDENGKVRSDKDALSDYKKFSKQYGGNNKNVTGSYIEMGPLATTNTSTWSSALGRVSAIGLDENDDNHIIVGSPTGGIWKTTDLGTTWTPLYDDEALIDVYALEISHINPDHYWAGLSGGIVRSIDGGITWSAVSGVNTFRLYNTIEMHPTDANILFAVDQNGGVVYKSSDGGNSFNVVMDHSSRMYDLEFHPTNSSIIYASGTDALFKSVDGGESFTEINSGPWNGSGNELMMAVTPSAPSSLYVLEEQSGGFNGLYLSVDEGVNWTTQTAYDGTNNYMGYNQTAQSGQAPRDMDIIVSPTDPDMVHVAGVETWRTDDLGGNYFQTTFWNNPGGSDFIHADIDLLIHEDNRIIAGTDGGIYYSTDDGISWTDITSGLGIRQFYRIGASQTDTDRVSGGSQDNGTGTVVNGTWLDWVGADGMETFIDWNNEDIIYGTTQFGGMEKSIDGGITRTSIAYPPESGNWVTPLEQDPMNSATLYTARSQVYKSTNGGANWIAISSFNASGNANEMKIAPSNPNYIYVSYGSTLYRTIDGGSNWTSSSFPSGSANYITVHPFDPLRISVALTSSSSKIVESFDGGETWNNLTDNIPSGVAIECLVYDYASTEGLYAGGNPGVYYTSSTTSPSWADVSTNLPKVRVTELEFKNTVLYVGTYGRGLWKYEFPCDASLEGVACNDYDPCTENDVYDSTCNCAGTLVGDDDGDSVCNTLDQCPGFDDTIDVDMDGIPDGCDSSIDCNNCPATITTFPFVEDFENGTGEICQFTSEELNWIIFSGATPSSGSGPSAAFSGNNYFYIEASGSNSPAKTGVFRGGCFDMTSYDSASIQFYYHMLGTTMGTLNLNISTDGGSNWDTVWTVSGNQGDQWNFYSHDLSLYAGGELTYAFSGVTGTSWSSDIALDLITVSASSDCIDEDNDGICVTDDCDDNDALVGAVGSSCDDGDSCTVNDVLDSACNCVGVYEDADGDGVCSGDDCNDNDASIGGVGSSCDDGNSCTSNDVLDSSCNCVGVLSDADNDGVCTLDDCDDNDASIGAIGSSCDDGDSCTVNDVLDSSCNCVGVYEDADGDGVCSGDDCNDNDALIGGVGSSCDDGNSCTSNDVLDSSCNCVGVLSDADNDGVCTLDDCDDNDASIGAIGSSCDDGDSCTVNDVLDSSCNCVGVYEDADGDGVCDADDICAGGDDMQDSDGDGIPDFCDCTEVSNSFSINPLTHSGSGSSSTSITFSGTTQGASFDINNLDSKLNGSPNGRYIDLVTVTYLNEQGNTILEGSYSGDVNSSVSINIDGVIQSVTVSLEDGYDGNFSGTLSITTTDVVSCQTLNCSDSDGDGVCDEADQCPDLDDALIGTSCDDGDSCTVNDVYDENCLCSGLFEDSDGDGVCDAEDVCEGGDDTMDSDGDGIPDFCDCTISTFSFSPSTLSHIGTGSSTVNLTFPNLVQNVEFTINNIDAVQNGNPSKRYIDLVEVQAIDGNGNTSTIGVYSGADQSSVSVTIPGGVLEVSISLSDAYDGDAPAIEIDLSTVTACSIDASNPLESQNNAVQQDSELGITTRSSGNEILYKEMSIYPNPASDFISVEFNRNKGEDYILMVQNQLGQQLLKVKGTTTDVTTTEILNIEGWTSGFYVVILKSGDVIDSKTFVIQE